ncbi:MAG TPA: SDR family NAD(P)-dependent oxidoreductase [Acidimicrobiales bacterium]|nr:SDR family NAD(P)-dependent oxidoreductase [Acidimicrobiales bacterium]
MLDALGRPQSVLLLGGTSEIGLAIVERLVTARCTTVVLAGRDREGLAGAAAALAANGKVTVHTVDLEATDPASCAAAVQQAFEVAPTIDLVVMALGALGDQATDERDPLATAEMIEANFTGPAALLAGAAARLVEAGQGRILVLSSVAGVRVRRANYLYGSAKAGLDGYALGLAESVRGTGVAVHIVRPGFVVGRMTAGRNQAPLATTPDAVAAACLRALETGAPITWVPEHLRFVFLVLRHAPAALWRRLPG